MKSKSSLRSAILAGSIAALLATPSAQAATFYWDANGNATTAVAATGTWGIDNFWSTDALGATATVAQTIDNTSDLFFSAASNSTGGIVTIDSTQSAHSITFDDATGGITLSGGTAINLGSATAGSGLFFTGNSANTISTPIILNSAATAIAITNSTASLQTIGDITGSAAGLQTVTVGTTSTGGITLGGIIGNGGGGGTVGLTLNSSGSGITTLTAANTYTGATTINRGTLTLNSQTGSLATTSPLTFSGTGTFNMDNVGASGDLTQTLGALTFSAGQGTVQTTRTVAFDQAITFASLAARTSGASGNFVNTGTNSATNGFVFTAAPTAGALIDRGIYYNGSAYATYDAGGFVRGFTAGDTDYLAAPTGATIGASTAASHVDLTTGNITAQTSVSANTINMRNFNIAMTGTSQVLSTNALLSSGSASATIGGGTTPLLTTATASADLVIRVNASSNVLTISSGIQNNGTTPVTKSGDGTLILSGANSYTGATSINAGVVKFGSTTALGVNGAVSVASGAVLDMNGVSMANTNALTLIGSGGGGTGALLNSTSGTGIYNGAISLAGATTIGATNSAGIMRISKFLATNGHTLTLKGPGQINFPTTASGITGGGSVVVDGAYLNLISGGNQAANSYTGTTTVQNGGAILYFSNNIGTGNINLNGGTIEGYFNEGFTRPFGTGSGQFQITGGVSGFGVNGSHTINFSNVTSVQWGSASFNPSKFVLGGGVNGGTTTFAENIDLNNADRTVTTNGGGVLSGVLSTSSGTAGLIKEGAGTLSPTVTNTYNGPTTITAGTLIANTTASLGNSSVTNTLIFNGGTLQASAAFNSAATRGVTMTATGIINTNTFAVGILGNIGGAGGLTKNSTGTLTLSGTNNYGGVTTVNAGTLAITKEVSLASNTAANLNVKSGAGLALNVDSAGTAGFTVANLDTLLGNILVASTAAQGLQAGAILSLDTSTASGATFTLGNAITNSTGASGGVISLIKLGAGTLVLDEANTYSGPTTISAGTLQLNAGGVISTPIANNATFAINSAGSVTQGTHFGFIGGTGAVTKAGAGTLTLNHLNNTYTGDTTASGGTIVMGHALALQNSAYDTASVAGGLDVTGYTSPILGGLTGSGNLTSSLITGYGSITNLTLNPQSGITKTYSGDIGLGAGTMSLTKTGAGTQILSAANTYTGATFINAGTLELSGAAGALASTAINLNGGNLTLINATGQSALNRVSNSATITANGGTITWTNPNGDNTANWAENIGILSLSTGQTNIVSTNVVNAARTQTLTLGAGSLTHAAANTSAITFSGASLGTTADDNNIVITSETGTAANQIIGAWATYGTSAAAQTDYAAYHITGGVANTRGIQGVAIAGSAETTWTTAANAYTVNAGAAGTGSAGLTGTRTITALRSISGANAMTVDNTVDTFSLTSNTFANGDAFTLGGTAPTGLTAGSIYYVVNKSGNTFQVASTPGGTAINFTTNGTSVTATGAITLSSGNNLETFGLLNGVATAALVLANGTGALTTPTGGGNLYLNAGAGAVTVSAPINNNSGNVTLVKNGSSTLTLSSTTSTYSGGTVLNAGTVSITANTNLGAAGTGITFNGNASLNSAVDSTLVDLGARTITLNSGAIATFIAGSRGNITVGGAVTGSGGITAAGSTFWMQSRFNSTANTFTGPITVASTSGSDGNWIFSFNSIEDATVTPGSGNISLSTSSNNSPVGIDYGSGASAPLSLTNRQIILGSQTSPGVYINNASSQALTINADIGFSGTGARLLILGRTAVLASGSGISTFAGKLTDNVGGALSVTAAGGAWVFSNNNTYTGTTTVSAGTLTLTNSNTTTGATNLTGGTLALTNANAIQNSALTVSGGTLRLLHDTNNTTFADTSTTISASATINVNNNGSGTGNTLNLGAVGVSAATTATLTVTNSNSYVLGLGALTQSPTTATTLTIANAAPMTIASYATNSTTGTARLAFTGLGTATITGNITQNGANALGLDRGTAAGTLILQGTSNMTGSVTITTGTIQTAVATNAFGSTSGISIGAAGTLALRGDSSAAFSNGTTNYPVSLTASLATINVDQASSAAPGTTLTLGTVAMPGLYTLNTTGANGVSLALGAVTGSTANNKVINNTIASPGGLTLASYAESDASARTITLQGAGYTTVTGNITQNGANALALTKSGAGTVALGGINAYTGLTTVSGGVLRLNSANALPGGIGLAGGTSALTLNGGILGLGNGDFTRALGTGVTQVSISTGSTTSGFAAFGADRTVNIGGAGGTVAFNAANFPTSILELSHATADATLIFANDISLGGGGRTINVNDGSASVDARITGVISNGNGFTKGGSGFLQLTGTNTWGAGTLTISGGTLELGNNTSTGSLTAVTTITNNARLSINRSNAFSQATGLGAGIAINGTGGFTQAGSGTTTLTVANGYTGTTIISGGTLQLGSGGTTGALTATTGITNNANLTIKRSNAFTQATDLNGQAINGTGSLTQDGSGTTTLSATNGYSGGTTISNGTLSISASGNLGDASATNDVTINGGTLQNTGAAVNLGVSRELAIGSSGGTVEVTTGNALTLSGMVTGTGNTLTKTGAGTLNFAVGSTQSYGTLAATAGVTNVNSAVGSGASTVSVTGGSTLKFGSVSQTLSSLTIGAGSTVTFTSGLASFSGGGGKAPSLGGSAVVPEPGTLGLLLVGALGVLNRRRRA